MLHSKFKTPTRIQGNQGRLPPASNDHSQKPSSNPISHFAETIFKNTNFAHRYPTPTSPSDSSSTRRKATVSNSRKVPWPKMEKHRAGPQVVVPQQTTMPKTQSGVSPHSVRHAVSTPQQPRPTQQQSPITPIPLTVMQNQNAFAQNTNISLNGFHQPTSTTGKDVAQAVYIPPSGIGKLPPSTPHTSTPQSTTIQPKIVVPPSSAESRQVNFITVEDSTSTSRKRKREFGHGTSIQISQTKDQRAASDAALRQLTDLSQDILEAVNESQSDSQCFVSAYYDDRETITLAPAVHVKLESCLHKVTSLGRLGEIPVDDLQRLQRLCEGALGSADSSDIHTNLECNSDDFDSWVQRLETIDAGLRSARTVLTTMTGGREEKLLYSEELLQLVLRVVQKALDSCVIPVVEARMSKPTSSLFDSSSNNKKVLSQLLHDTNKVMGLFGKLLAKEEMAETIITSIEFLAVRLMFVENAPAEKESVLGIQKYEVLRRTAMDMIAIIFSRYTGQRDFLFDEILTSLQKLPTSRQAARKFRLFDGRAIQLVSALIMRLVQTSATASTTPKKTKIRKAMALSNDESGSGNQSDDDMPNGAKGAQDSEESDNETDASHSGPTGAMRHLSKDANACCDSAAKSAQHAVGYLVQRAQTASKTGDQPHRHLLDIFVEDLLTVLSHPEWPAAEILLRAVCARTTHIIENPKSLAPAKNMALELLGTMGSAISELVASTRHAAKGLESSDTDFSGYLRQMLDEYTDGSLETTEILRWDGPYHAVVEFLRPANSDDLQSASAQGYYLAQWAKAVSSSTPKSNPENDKTAVRLRKMLLGLEWPPSGFLDTIPSSEANVAYALTILNMDFCRRFDYILKILLDSVSSEQTTVRSRGLKSVTQMLEKDPSLLDRARSVKALILKCATDTSPMVRDAALTLIGKCLTLKPALELDFLKHIIHLCNDYAIGVRKRSMKLLKDIYLRSSSKDVKAAIGDTLLQRAKDPDTGVTELARQTFEEIWMSPFWTFTDLASASVQNKISLQEQVYLIVRIANRGDGMRAVLVQILKDVLSTNSKNATANFEVCKSFVATALEVTIDSAQLPESLEQGQVLEALTLFAKAKPTLFTSDQLQFLQPYIGSLSNVNDLDLFRPVVVIFRCVLPILSSVEHGFLEEIQTALLKSVSKLSKAELDEVAECLWTINSTLQKPEPLLKLIASVLKNLHALENLNFADAEQRGNLARVRKYLQIAGFFGKHCDFESYSEAFQNILPWFKGGSVAGLIVQSLKPYALASQPLPLRAVAFDSIGLICQSWPFQFTRTHISKAFESVLREGEPELQAIVLSSFRDFFNKIERQAEAKMEETADKSGEPPTGGKLGGSMTVSDGDSASALIAQHFLKDVLSIALASQDDSALTATEVIASINRQGLAHPKESGPALVALETSTNTAIAQVAFQEHRILHQQHESMFEREYMRAIQETFRYQREVVKDTMGYITQPYAAKMNGMWEIIKTSKAKYQKKFLSNYCSKIDFDITKLDTLGNPPNSLQFARFLTENLAFFDYTRLDELLHTISCMEKVVADTGSGVAHGISTEVFNITVQADAAQAEAVQADVKPEPGEQPREPSTIGPTQGSSTPIMDPSRLRQLTTASIILFSLWEARTYLRRAYGQSASQQRREGGKGKTAVKDLNRTLTKVQGVTGDKLVAAIAERVASLNSEESMLKQCQEFVELLSVDSEVKVMADSEESLGERPETPEADGDERDTPMSGGSRGLKRRNSVSAAGTPLKKKRGRPSLGRKKSSRKSIHEEEDEDWG